MINEPPKERQTRYNEYWNPEYGATYDDLTQYFKPENWYDDREHIDLETGEVHYGYYSKEYG